MICMEWKPWVRELSSGQLELFAKDGPGLPLETALWGPGQEPETKGSAGGLGRASVHF